MVLTAGGPEGRLLASLLDAVPPVDLVEVAGHTRVNVTIVTGGAPTSANERAGGEPTKVNEPGSALCPAEADALVDATEKAVAGAAWLACCGSLPVGTDPDLVARLVAAGHAAGVPVAVDSSGPALAAAVKARADLVKPNADELAELVAEGMPPVDAAVEIQRRTGGTVLASLGADGALLVTPDGAWHATPPPIVPVNTTGAGDALLAGYLAAWEAGPVARLAYAVAVGTAACLVEATAGVDTDHIDPPAVAVRPVHPKGG
jgi:1-phosphofructokinase